MRRLSEGQNVTLLYGTSRLRCCVIAVERGEAALHPLRMMSKPMHGDADNVNEATLAFDYQGTLVAISGWLRWGSEHDADVRFHAKGVHVPQQRESSRLRIALGVRVHWPDGSTTDARTADISAGGLSVRPAGPAQAGDTIGVEIAIPDRLPPLETRVLVVRATRQVTAGPFLDIPEPQRQRLSRFVFAVQRMIATGEVAAG